MAYVVCVEPTDTTNSIALTLLGSLFMAFLLVELSIRSEVRMRCRVILLDIPSAKFLKVVPEPKPDLVCPVNIGV